MIKNLYQNEKIRYLFVGGVNTVLAYGLFFLLITFDFGYKESLLIGYLAALINGYLMNKYLVFKTSKKSFSEMFKYLLVYIFQYIIGIVLISLFIDVLCINKYLSGLLTVIIAVTASYVGNKYFAYRI